MHERVIVVGAFHEVIELCELCGKQILGIIDNNLTASYHGYEILGNDGDAMKILKELGEIPVIITPDTPAVRAKLVQFYSGIGFTFCNLISPKASVSKSCKVGKGVIIQTGANVSSNVVLGDFVKINVFANIMHDATVGDYCTVAPNAIVLGRATVGPFSYIGSNATLLPGRAIGANVVVGAGAVVTRGVESNAAVVGNPAHIHAKKEEQSIGLSVVVPVRNEENNLQQLSDRLGLTLHNLGMPYEIIFVTDVNTDRTYERLKELNEKDPRIKVVKLSHSYGQHVAVLAGLTLSRGQAVVTMDGDLQDCPEDITRLHSKLIEGYDIVYGVKERKDDSRFRNLLSRLFVRLITVLSDSDLEFNTSMFRIMSRRTVLEILRFKEREPSLTGITSLIGFPTASVPVLSARRREGSSKYSFPRQVNLAISFLLSFSTKPLRLISLAGIVTSFASFFYMLVVIAQAVFLKVGVLGWPTIIALITFLGGVQLLAIGVIGEYIGKTFMETKGRPLLTIDEKIGDF